MISNLQAIEVLNAIYGRRAIRRYSSEPIGREALEELIETAIQAPSAMNQQPWAFAVITGARQLESFSERVKAHVLELLDGPFPHPTSMLGPEVNVFHGAPALVVICATSPESQAAEDCCLAAQNLMLAAFANGFGTCPIGLARPWLSLAPIKRELGIPESWIPVFPIAIGKPDENPQGPGRRPTEILWR